jgi:Cu2+-exporting ATPase
MACGSGCCGPKPAPATDTTAETVRNSVGQAETDSCCESNAGDAKDDASSLQALQLEPVAGVLDNSANDMPAAAPGTGCADGCCAAPTEAENKPHPPPCCAGKPSPCCDMSCLERLALRACEDKKGSAEVADASSGTYWIPTPCFVPELMALLRFFLRWD